MRHFDQRNISQSGFGLVEALVGFAIVVIVLVGFVSAFQTYLSVQSLNTEKIQAAYILEEGVELTRYLRDESFSTNIETLSVDTPYYVYMSTSTVIATTTATTTGTFTRFPHVCSCSIAAARKVSAAASKIS